MKSIIAVLFLALVAAGGLALSASAPDRVLEFRNVVVTLQDKPCDVKVLIDGVPLESRHRLKAGTARYNGADPLGRAGQTRKLCYMEHEEAVVAVDEDLAVGSFRLPPKKDSF